MSFLKRLENILEKEKIELIKQKKVAIIGLGGVGGHALESIVRIGIQNIIIVDNDVFDITNLNRQLLSNLNNIGKSKTSEAIKKIKSINEYCNVKELNIFLDKSNIGELINEKPDYIIDACDTITTKILLIKESLKNNIEIISCMGTGNKFDPTLLEITTLNKTSYDPIAKIIRKKLTDENITLKIPVVFSKEKPIKTKTRTPGSTSLVPPTAGLFCSSYVINHILKDK